MTLDLHNECDATDTNQKRNKVTKARVMVVAKKSRIRHSVSTKSG